MNSMTDKLAEALIVADLHSARQLLVLCRLLRVDKRERSITQKR